MEIKWNSLKLQVGFAYFFQIRKLVCVLEQFEVRLNQTVNIFITALERMHINRIYRAHLFVPGSKHLRELRAYTVCKEQPWMEIYKLFPLNVLKLFWCLIWQENNFTLFT